jgi:putative hydrolase of the HAD superfamily
MNTAFQNIIFCDIGGVLLSNGWGHESREAAARHFNFDYIEMNRLHEFIFNIYEIGRLTLDEYLDTTLFYKPRDFTKEDVKAFIYAQSVQLPYMLDWLIDWKKSHNGQFRIISINNEGKELNDYRIKKFKLHQCFDAFISSCEVGMRKPDPGIFRLAMGVAKADPEQCIYFDDRPMLVEAARRLRINGYLHENFESTKKILMDLSQ